MIDKLKKSSEYFIYICGILLLASVLLISIEVVLRKFFLISFGGADELSGYTLGIIGSIAGIAEIAKDITTDKKS